MIVDMINEPPAAERGKHLVVLMMSRGHVRGRVCQREAESLCSEVPVSNTNDHVESSK